MKQLPALATLAAFSLISSPLLAHPGHNPLDHGPAHLLTNTNHLITVVAMGILLTFFLFTAKKWIKSSGIRWTVASILGSTVAIWCLAL